MLKPAFGSVSMLLSILIVGILFVMLIPMLKSTSGVGKSSINQQSVEDRANEMIKEIELQKEQAIQYYNSSDEN